MPGFFVLSIDSKKYEGDFLDDINPNSITTLTDCKLEPSVVDETVGTAMAHNH